MSHKSVDVIFIIFYFMNLRIRRNVLIENISLNCVYHSNTLYCYFLVLRRIRYVIDYININIHV